MQGEVSLATSKRKTFVESIFGVFYVMTEGDFPSGGIWKFRFTVALLLIDGLQVLRSLAVSNYSWTDYSISVMRSVDLVSLFFHTVQEVVPEWIFFSFAILVAIGAIVNAGYVMKLFRAGHVKIIWPLKILRMLVASIVTVFFTTVLEFLIYPVRCVGISHEDNFSAVLHGSPRPCNPWDVPEMTLSIPTIIIATAFIVFSLLTTFLDFTINPLCRHPLAQCTGRLESLWTLFKVAALLLVYIAPFISAMACSILLFLLSVFICYYHFTVLPFHHEAINMVRGGIYLSSVAFCLACMIVQQYPNRQNLQNWLIGSVLVAFLLGMFIVSQIMAAVNRYLGVLRGQWDEQARAAAENHGRRGRRQSLVSEASQACGGLVTERSMHEQFFDVKWEVQRRFTSGSVAYLAARALLQRRNQDEMMFLMSLLTQCLKDHPNSQSLSMFHLLVLRYVFKERSQALAQDKLSKMQSGTFVLDRSYVLFAVQKKTVQEGASESLGKGSISAVNLMEFDQRMDVARKCHRECVVAIKAFWKHVAKRRRHAKAHDAPERVRSPDARRAPASSIANSAATRVTVLEGQAQKMSEELEKFSKAMEQARQEFAWLYEKYPSSAPLLSSYANFCDHVLNDNRKADQLRQQVSVMESYGKVDELSADEVEEEDDAIDAAIAGGVADKDNKSVSTDSEPYRVQMARYMSSWAHLIMSRDAAMLRGLHWRVKCAIFFLVTLSLTSFIVTDFVLFNDVALKTIRDIDETGHFRELAATAPHLIRSQMIEAHIGHPDLYLDIKHYVIDLTKKMQEDHYATFEAISTSAIEHFYEDPDLEVNIPRPSGWEHTYQSFRHLGSDFARRVASAASAQFHEHDDPNFELANISQEKRDIAYVFENMIRYVLPSFDQAVAIYEHQMQDFGKLTTILTSVAAALTGTLVIAIAVNVLRARADVIKRVHSNRVSISLACELPQAVAVRFYKYFSEVELDMAMMEDDNEEDLKRRMVETENECARRGSVDGIKRRPSLSSVDLPAKRVPSAGSFAKPRSHSLPRSVGQNPLCDSDIEIHPRQLRSPLHAALRVPSANTAEDMPPSRLTADNLQLLIEKTKCDESSLPPQSPLVPFGRMRAMNSEGQTQDPQTRDESDHPDEGEEIECAGFFPSKNQIDDGEHIMENEIEHGDAEEGETEQEEDSEADPELSAGRHSALVFVERQKDGRSPTDQLAQGGDTPSTEDDDIEMAASFKWEDGNLPADGTTADTSAANGNGFKDGTPRKKEESVGDEAEGERSGGSRPRKTILRMDSESTVAEEAVQSAAGGEHDAASSTNWRKNLRFSSSAADDKLTTRASEQKNRKGFSGLLAFMEDGKSKKQRNAVKEVSEEHEDKSREEGRPGEHILDLQEMQPEMQEALSQLQYKGQPWFNRFHVYVVSLIALLALCMLYSLYPARHVTTIVTMAPTMDKATERMSLARACIFLARELVLHDGLPRMSQGEISGTLDSFIHKYEEADRAVRLGDKDLGIMEGADHRSKIHNEVMYKLGCPWRQRHRRGAASSGVVVDDESVSSECSLPNTTYPRAAEDGLFNLQSAFLDSLKTILRKHGTAESEYVTTYNKHREDGEDVSVYEHVHQDEASYDILAHDPDLLFIELMFDGDLHDGLDYMVFLFEEETRELLDVVHLETRLLFGIYIAFLLVGFYWSLFMRTLKAARMEVSKAQEFAHTVPLHVLEADEAATVKAFYMRDNGMEQDQHDGDNADD